MSRNYVSSEIGMWAPNGVLLIIALLVIYAIRERAPIPLFPFLKRKQSNDTISIIVKKKMEELK